jgi:protein-S-isoprenylcysteine O-methyltransferase Ste14
LARVGGWLFKHRTSIPLPIVAALVLVPPDLPGHRTNAQLVPWLIGILLVGAGEWIRLRAVHHIGAISRTRSDRVGPLIESGPFAHTRNPLYLGNVLLWLGFTISARLLWLTPIVILLLASEYHAIVRWEEHLLEARLGTAYRAYKERVPRWLPRLTPAAPRHDDQSSSFSWRDTFYSERGTLIAIVAGYVLLAIKAREVPSLFTRNGF